MSNNNYNNGIKQVQQFMQANTNYNVELVKGKNEKQATRMHVYIDNKLIANISTSAFTKTDFIDTLENLKTNNNSFSSAKVEHANSRGNIEKQVKTYCKDELYMLNYTENDTTLDIDKNYSCFNWVNFLQGLVNNKYVISINEVISYKEKAKAYFNTNPVYNFIRIGRDMFITKHTYNKVIAIKRKYMEYLKANKLILSKEFKVIPCTCHV